MSLESSIEDAFEEAPRETEEPNHANMQEKVTINFFKYQRDKSGATVNNDSGNPKQAFEKCLVLELDSAKVRAIEACVEYPEAVKALVRDLLEEHQCDHAEIAATLRDKDGKTRFIRTYKLNMKGAENLAQYRAAKQQ